MSSYGEGQKRQSALKRCAVAAAAQTARCY